MTTFLCGNVGPDPEFARAKVTVHRYKCPWCLGHGTWVDDRCHHCGGQGTTDDPSDGVDLHTDYPSGVEPPITKAEPLPRPPGVMRSPCVDCAYRPGSPEQTSGMVLPRGDEMPFMCHHGLARVDTDGAAGYLPMMTVAGGFPVGALVCASWYALALGEPLPASAFKDPGGNDRTESARA